MFLLFPFQAYSVAALLIYAFFSANTPRHFHYYGMGQFTLIISYGYAASFVVLLCVGIAQFCARRPKSGFVNIGLAVLSLLCGIALPNYVES